VTITEKKDSARLEAPRMEETTFERQTELDLDEPTLIEGLPGHGLVASIAVDHVTKQLGLDFHGRITSDAFPAVVTYDEGKVRDPVRVYGGADPDVFTLQSDLALPDEAFRPLAKCVMADLSERFDRAIFLAGAPAQSEDDVGNVRGVATTDGMRDRLRDADVELADEPGVVGGVTGALVSECYQGGVPAAVLIVESHPYLPDPTAARAVIEDALEPLVHFDIDTTELAEQADEIESRMQQVAQQYRRMQKKQDDESAQDTRMFQ
jgi:uncharacterized protein